MEKKKLTPDEINAGEDWVLAFLAGRKLGLMGEELKYAKTDQWEYGRWCRVRAEMLAYVEREVRRGLIRGH